MLEKNAFLQLERSLTSRQRAFCEHYVKTGSATAAEKVAGLSHKVCSAMLRNPKCAAYIEELSFRTKQIAKISKDMVRDELKEIAFFDVGQLIKYEDGKFILKSEEALEKFGRFIKKIRYNDKTKHTEVEFYDKLDALDKLAKHIGFYELDNEQKRDQVVQFYLPDNNRDKEKPLDLDRLVNNTGANGRNNWDEAEVIE